MATVYQYFETEFLHAFVAKKQMAAVGGMRTIHFDTAVHLDFDACAAYVSIYLPMNI